MGGGCPGLIPPSAATAYDSIFFFFLSLVGRPPYATSAMDYDLSFATASFIQLFWTRSSGQSGQTEETHRIRREL